MICGIWATEADRLEPQQWVNIWQVDVMGRACYYATCQVLELPTVLQDLDLEDVGLELCGSGEGSDVF